MTGEQRWHAIGAAEGAVLLVVRAAPPLMMRLVEECKETVIWGSWTLEKS